MHIRQALSVDAAPLSRLACATYVEHFAPLWGEAGLAAYLESEFSVPALSRGLAAADQAWFLVGDDDGLAGFAKVNWSRREPQSRMLGAELRKIYFRADRVGRGHGAQLLAHVMDVARRHGETHLWLNVLARNTGAQRFYLRHGLAHLGASVLHTDVGPLEMLAMGRALD